jgi:hypothetical protein
VNIGEIIEAKDRTIRRGLLESVIGCFIPSIVDDILESDAIIDRLFAPRILSGPSVIQIIGRDGDNKTITMTSDHKGTNYNLINEICEINIFVTGFVKDVSWIDDSIGYCTLSSVSFKKNACLDDEAYNYYVCALFGKKISHLLKDTLESNQTMI